MRVVYLNPSAQMGGAEVALLDFLASLREAEPNWRLHLIVSDEGPVVVKARALGVNTAVVPFPRSLARLGDSSVGGPAGRQQSRLALIAGIVLAAPGIVAYVKRLRRAIRNWAPDLVHTNGFKMHIMGAWAVPRAVPLIWHIHDYVSARPLMARLLRRYSSRCALALANSESVAADLQTVCGDGLQVKTIYNGINLESFSPQGPTLDLDALSGLPPANSDTIRVGMLATMARWKGHDVFLRAMALIPADLPVRGYIAGGPIYQTNGSQHSLEELKRQINQLGLSERVGLTGFIDNPSAAMRALDIVVHASDRRSGLACRPDRSRSLTGLTGLATRTVC